jgi:TRAP-type C4-dicarboxylate transport system permease small subunit
MKILYSAASAITYFSKILNIGGIAVLGMLTCLTTVDVMGRYLFRHPVIGSVELTEYMMACIAFLGLAWCAAAGRHVKVTLLLSRFRPRVQAILDSFTLFITLGVLAIMTWRGVLESLTIWDIHRESLLLKIPTYPFYWVMSLGFTFLCLVVLVQLVQSVAKAAKSE